VWGRSRSDNGLAIASKSTNVLGQPCVNSSGTAAGAAARRWTKCTVCPSISVMNCGRSLVGQLIRPSARQQPARQVVHVRLGDLDPKRATRRHAAPAQRTGGG
jgi:hypothetical protein